MRLIALALCCTLGANASAQHWTKLPSLPDPEGFASSFAGVSSDTLLVAGGANFPGKKPWEGGTKVWYDNVFALSDPNGQWKIVGRLPKPLGYGVSVTWKDSLICIGGSDAQNHYRDVSQLTLDRGTLRIEPLAQLPQPIANACGALVGSYVYVVGGQESPTATSASNKAYRLDLSQPSAKWEAVADCPGPGRMLSIASSYDNAFWIIGGVELIANDQGPPKRRYLKDAYRFDDRKGWQKIIDFPTAIAAAATPSPSNPTGFYLLGGDDGSQVGVSPERHQGFSDKIFYFDVKAQQWKSAGTVEAPRVTLPTVYWKNSWLLISGEKRPGIRSPEVWSFTTPSTN
jgi:N-acetylneuraminate epimerase